MVTEREWPGRHLLVQSNKGSTRNWYEMWSVLTIKTPERSRRRSSVFSINFEHISTFFCCFFY